MKFKQFLPHVIAIVIFLLTVVFMFSPQFSGKQLRMGDIQSHRIATKEIRDFREQTGERANWTGTSFSGMPTYQMSTVSDGNYMSSVGKVLGGFMPVPAGLFLAGMLCAYLLLILVGVNPWLSIAGALGAAMATNGLILIEAGHTSKIAVTMYLPLVAAGILLAFARRYLLGGLLFTLGMALALRANHPQMLYYFGLTVLLYGLARLITDLRAGQLVHFGKAMGVLLVGLLVAVGSGASNLMTTFEYKAASMRGGQVLETPLQAASGADAPDDGLEWEYAMQWSNNLKDLVATYSPYAAGGGGAVEVASSSDFGKAMRQAGFQIRSGINAPTYHGGLPFTEGPAYLGAVVWALFLFGLFTARRNLVIWLGGGTLLIFLMSMGKYLEGFNHLLYDTLPLLSAFRAPSSAVSISAMMMVVLGIIGVNDWLKTRETTPDKARKQLLYAGITAGALGLFVAVLLPGFIDFTGANDAGTLQRMTGGQLQNVAPVLDGLEATRADLYSADAWRSFLFVGLAFGVLFLLFRKIATPLVGGLALATLVAADFAGVNGRYIAKEDWRKPPRRTAEFQPTPVDQQILQDPDPHYRVMNLTVSTFQDNSPTSYFHKSVGGYSAVKMRRYQDLIDGYLAKRNPDGTMSRDQDVINMLNTKYFILPGQNNAPQAQRNPNAYGPAWLVNNIQTIPTNDAEFAALGTVTDLKNTAIVHQEFTDAVSGLQPSGQGSITLTEYSPVELSYQVNAQGEQLAVFSEIWYGPGLGWEATIDGEPAELIRANYALRALRIPSGQHTVTMSFRPSSFATGKTLSLICNLLILLGLAGYLGYQFIQKKRGAETVMPTEAR
ncbi:MAG: YfhO family protein [Bacteroidota bacterium]